MATKERLNELYDYDEVTGELNRKSKKSVTPRKPFEDRAQIYSNIYFDGKTVREHKAVWIWHYGDIEEGKVIDHINGNVKDNRITNLRLCTPSQNHMNRKGKPNSKTGLKGVGINASGNYYAQIFVEKKMQRLGTFKDAKDAAKAYDAAAELYFGDFAKTNASMGLI